MIAARQRFLGREDYGYFEIVAEGDVAVPLGRYKVGSKVRLLGQLWNRKYRNREAQTINETKIIVKEICESEDI